MKNVIYEKKVLEEGKLCLTAGDQKEPAVSKYPIFPRPQRGRTKKSQII